MFSQVAGEILERGIAAIKKDAASEHSKIRSVFRGIASYPAKVLATFISAPFLIVILAWKVKDPIRRIIAIAGLLISLLVAYAVGTSLGSLIGAAFIASSFGILTAIGFLIGTTVSVYLSVIFSIIVFNATSFLFLKMSTQEVADYLKNLQT